MITWSNSFKRADTQRMLGIRAWCDGGYASGKAAIGWSVQTAFSRDVAGSLIWRTSAECGVPVFASGSMEAELIACREVVLAALALRTAGFIPFDQYRMVDVSALKRGL